MSELLVNTIKKADGTGSITVPADTGTLLTSVSSIPVANLDSAVGITHADVFRLSSSSNLNGGGNLTSNFERADDATSGIIGSGMTESSGIFTFPETGIWLVMFNARWSSTGGVNYAQIYTEVSTNSGSSYDEVSLSSCHMDTSGRYQSAMNIVLIDVTNASTFKVKFTYLTSTTTTLIGDSTRNDTCATFIRLGDT